MMSSSRKEDANVDWSVVHDFGEEWKSFDYGSLDKDKLKENFIQYFGIFPFEKISKNSEGFDMGCGTGRWAQYVAPLVGKLNCIDPSQALEVAKSNLKNFDNVTYLNETVSNCSLEDNSQDFGYSLGVLHHIPDTAQGIKDCAKKLKSGAPFLLYLYYSFENKPIWFKLIWKFSNIFRFIISKMPSMLKKLVCHIISALVYYPLARSALVLEKLGFNVENIPLCDYRNKPYYQMKNDSLDRFGTRLEQRFSRKEIKIMLTEAGFENIKFSDSMPYWVSIAYKK